MSLENDISEEIIDQHHEATNMLSEIEFWALELGFFDRLLRQRALSTGSQYGDRIAENLQQILLDLQRDLNALKTELMQHEHLLVNLSNKESESADHQYSEQHENCLVHTGQFNKRFKAYKKDLFTFAERYGDTGD